MSTLSNRYSFWIGAYLTGEEFDKDGVFYDTDDSVPSILDDVVAKDDPLDGSCNSGSGPYVCNCVMYTVFDQYANYWTDAPCDDPKMSVCEMK